LRATDPGRGLEDATAEFIAGLGGAMMVGLRTALPQQTAGPLIGFFSGFAGWEGSPGKSTAPGSSSWSPLRRPCCHC
jgi:hypothetical protein